MSIGTVVLVFNEKVRGLCTGFALPGRVVCWRGVLGVVRDRARDDDGVDEIVEAMMRRGVFPLPCHSMAAGGWQGTGHEFCVMCRR